MIFICLMSLPAILGLYLIYACGRKAEALKVFLIIAAFCASRILFRTGWEKITGESLGIHHCLSEYILLGINFLVLSVIYIVGLNRITKNNFITLGWNTNGFMLKTALGILIGCMILLVINKIPKVDKLAGAAFFSFFIASWQEENIFRGYLMAYLEQRFNIEETIIFQAFIYSLAHLGFYPMDSIGKMAASLIFAFMLGLLFGFLRHRTRSQIPGFIIHGIVDTGLLS